MTPDQMYEEIMEDIPNMLAMLGKKEKKVRQIVLRSQLFPVYIHSFITTKRRNNWLLLWNIESKKDVSGQIYANCSCIQDTNEGKYAIMRQITDGLPSLVIYSPHFFQRYAERMALNLQGISLIRKFFEVNTSFFIKSRIINGKEEVTATLNEGVAFCKEIENCKHRCFVMKTFINYDMRRIEQEPGFLESELQRIYEDTRFKEEISKNPNLLLMDALL